ncbi:PREDICTED: histone-lysine N-methyltransferase EZA1-like isoform X3 [Camelina sativa]|uniref:Histone-lysine N-methyltransferase EZA1-like isoform X3 n=1 Tax=Camelina sativa TaxID=90675 RepID=A0ABM0TNT3_CAMSA|nr:PREDICTED: histone-lysine N-methyltransferase EZA1-like isoform X3 [Camelina sativa]
MVKEDSDSSERIVSHVDDDDDDGDDGVSIEGLENRLGELKRKIQGERARSIKEKFEANRKKVDVNVIPLSSAALNRVTSSGENENSNLFASRMETPLCKLNGFSHGVGDRDYVPTKDIISASVKLPIAERIPPYTTWIFLDRNQRMAEDQSVVGRRQIYYEHHGGETLICSDSEEEPEPEEEKREYSEGEDSVIWSIGQEYGMGEKVQDALCQFLSVDASDILERYNELKLKNVENVEGFSNSGFKLGISLEKGLGAALDSFDNLFCRRCLVFDCRLHGCSQPLITASEKQPYWSDYEGDRIPCSKNCYIQAVREVPGASSNFASRTEEKASEKEGSKAVSSDDLHDATGGVNMQVEKTDVDSMNLDSSSGVDHGHGIRGKRELPNLEDSNDLSSSSNKKQKIAASDTNISYVNPIPSLDQALDSTKGDQGGTLDTNKVDRDSGTDAKVTERIPDNLVHDGGSSVCQPDHVSGNGAIIIGEKSETSQPSTEWKPIEKDLYLKGVEIFGRNSCLIARNLLSGLKTCLDVSSYMRENEVSCFRRSGTPNLLLDDGRTDPGNDDDEVPPRTRLFRRKGKTRKLKYSTKSAGHPSVWKRIAGGKNQSCKQYTPCGCVSMCGKDCPCLTNETCCEKYCGCSKSCKNRFRGCHCAKSQCRSRQCPCFAAGRECDPDVCRNCWVSCGDGTLGEAPRRGEGQCGNMRLLLRQQQRILLGKSDVAGWGAFLKNSVSKNEYLGEYTGELISHREADKRGKIYDRANSSFLFDLNDQYVLDAQRKGDKLKFANHSAKPNCYAKVMFVAGDHRVGIFANERIEASEELFYDYRYGPDQAPAWARKPEGSKKDDSAITHRRARKHQSH